MTSETIAPELKTTTHHSAPVPAADSGFAALGLSPTLCQVVAELGFATPTPVPS